MTASTVGACTDRPESDLIADATAGICAAADRLRSGWPDTKHLVELVGHARTLVELTDAGTAFDDVIGRLWMIAR